jgi:hypothetical protein
LDCPVASQKYKKYVKKDIAFKHQRKLLNRLREPIGEAFGLHENVVKQSKMHEIRSFADIMISKDFEGLTEVSKPVLKDLLEYSMHMLTRPVVYEP